MVVQGGGELFHVGAWGGPHLAHHMDGVDPRGRRQGQQMLGHAYRRRHQLGGVDQPVHEADLVEALRGEAEAQRHFHGHGIGQVGDVAVIVAAQQPALGLGDLEDGLAHGHAQVGAFHQHEATAHGEAVDGGDDRLLERARHERVLDLGAPSAGRAVLQRLLHILAGAEAAAGAGEDRDFELLAVAELVPDLGQLGAHLVIEGVQPIRPVHADDEDLSVGFGFDDGHAAAPHGRKSGGKIEGGSLSPDAGQRERGLCAAISLRI